MSTSTSPAAGRRGRSAKRAAIAPPSPCPTSTGGDGQVCSISSPSHPSTRSVSSWPSATSEAPWPGRSGATTRWVATRSRDHPQPEGRELARAVQQDHRRAVTALQHGGRDAGQLQLPLGDGDPGQQPLASVRRRAGPAAPLGLSAHRAGWSARDLVMACSSLVEVVRSSGPTLELARMPGIGGTTQLPPEGRRGYLAAAWVASRHKGRSDELVLVGVGGGRRPRRTPRAW